MRRSLLPMDLKCLEGAIDVVSQHREARVKSFPSVIRAYSIGNSRESLAPRISLHRTALQGSVPK